MRLINLVGLTLAIAIALAADNACAQTMGEYATTTAGVASGGGGFGTSMAPPITYGRDGYSGYEGGSRTWQTNGWGGSWSDRVGSRSATGGADFSSRAAAASGSSGGESRWPDTQRFGNSGGGSDSSGRFSTGERFSAGDRFKSGERFNTGDRFSTTSRFHDNMGIDTSFNAH